MDQKLVQGVGINDSNYVTIRRLYKSSEKWVCPFYAKWSEMLRRCYSLEFHQRSPTYKDCLVCDEWLTFSNFKSWMETQDWEGKHLDKDLLVLGNKLYSPETCCFVPIYVNSFLVKSNSARGAYPLGVYLSHNNGKFQSHIKVAGKQKYLGYFKTPEQAHRAWQKAKSAIAFDLSLEQTDERVKQGLMRVYEKILSDYENNLETIDF